ncbi:MAG TPA: hypothetical protein DD635_04840 [Flavobacteriales bacterium]|nr:hypothetical protein [Flavobacteriales bacterium]
MNPKFQRFWVAMSLTLSLHALVLFVFWMQPVVRFAAVARAFVPVEFVDLGSIQDAAPNLENQLRTQMESRIANLVADASVSVSSELRSTNVRDERRLAEEVESELHAFEQAEFGRLAAEHKDFDLEGVPNDGQNDQINTLAGWDNRYEGRVIVSYDVANRKHIYLPIPGYQCLEAGKVVVKVEIARDGHVTKARVVKSAEGDEEACLNSSALKYARRSLFEIGSDVNVSGTITYEFVAQ